MAQDTALLRYLLKWARRAPWSWSQRDLAFEFDWTDDYISSNATIGRTGYDMNVSGNVTTGSDGDGSYINFNGSRDASIPAWTWASILWLTAPWFNQWTDVTISVKFKLLSLPSANVSWLFWSTFDMTIAVNTLYLTYWIRGSSIVAPSTTVSLDTVYKMTLVYKSSEWKFYGYLSTTWGPSVLLNPWWTVWPTTRSTDSWCIWDNAIITWNANSSLKQIYHACIRNKALTQAEIDADIALWNTAKQDPSIVAYYVPDNLQYNTQYIANPKDLSNASWAKFFSCSVTANTTVAPDGTTTADTVTFIANQNSQTYETNTSVTWSSLASKTFIIKAFVKVATTNKDFRLKLSHVWVADYQSWNLTATTTRQEFTFTQTFTSSTSWTWINIWVMNASTAILWDIQVRNVRVYLVNETLRDESPNIWWFIGRKQNKVLSCRVKPNIDAPDSFAAQGLMEITWARIHIRSSSNVVRMRYDNRLWARESIYTLWNWFRDKVHALWLITWNWSWWTTKLYINWILRDTDNRSVDPQWLSGRSTSLWMWRIGTTYFSWNIRDARIYTFTWSFTAADALAIYNWWEPTSVWVTKYLQYKPPVGEVGTTTQDLSPNDRDWTLNGGVTRIYL